jgi:hypothetical protein
MEVYKILAVDLLLHCPFISTEVASERCACKHTHTHTHTQEAPCMYERYPFNVTPKSAFICSYQSAKDNDHATEITLHTLHTCDLLVSLIPAYVLSPS